MIITLSNYIGPLFLVINRLKKLRIGQFRIFRGVKRSRRLLIIYEKSLIVRRNKPKPSSKTLRVFLVAFLLCILGKSYYPYPLASRRYYHANKEDKLLDSE